MVSAPVAMQLTSANFREGQMIPSEFTCDGQDVSPPLAWVDAPAGTRSFALRCFDPDAPGRGWLHWLVVSIPAGAREIPRGGPLPTGALELSNDFGKTAYGGPCPPSGVHRYEFTLYALDTVELEDVTTENFEGLVGPHILATAKLTGCYQRQR